MTSSLAHEMLTADLPLTREHVVPASAERRAEVLANPGFGVHFTDHMVVVRWTAGQGWHDAKLTAHDALSLSPAAAVLHYSQTIFEGLKAYRRADGSIVTFRPEANAARFARSARRLAMPEFPQDGFVAAIDALVQVDSEWVSADAEKSLYLRPFMFASETFLGVRPAKNYLFLVIASPAGAYFPRGVKPVSVYVSEDYIRAAIGGTGEAKCGGNYAASLLAQEQAIAAGCDQVVFLDANEKRYIEEMGGMNLFFVFGDSSTDDPSDVELVTPELSGSLLEGITRDSVMTLAKEFGYRVTERKISLEEWRKAAMSGELTESFACGTAAVITPVGEVKAHTGDFTVGGGDSGPVTLRLREHLLGIQHGAVADSHGWVHQIS